MVKIDQPYRLNGTFYSSRWGYALKAAGRRDWLQRGFPQRGSFPGKVTRRSSRTSGTRLPAIVEQKFRFCAVLRAKPVRRREQPASNRIAVTRLLHPDGESILCRPRWHRNAGRRTWRGSGSVSCPGREDAPVRAAASVAREIEVVCSESCVENGDQAAGNENECRAEIARKVAGLSTAPNVQMRQPRLSAFISNCIQVPGRDDRKRW